MPSCNTYHLTWVSLTLGVGSLFTAAPAKRSRCSLPWTRGISSSPPLLTLMWNSSSRPSCARAATAPWTWGCSSRQSPLALGVGLVLLAAASGLKRGGVGSSSRPPPLTSDLGSSSPPFLRHRSLALSAAAPDLRRGVTPLGHHPSGMGSSRLLPLTSDVG